MFLTIISNSPNDFYLENWIINWKYEHKYLGLYSTIMGT